MFDEPARFTQDRPMSKPVFRFAPSPNGHLHLGHAFSALLNQALARDMGGVLLLRIEDIDTARCKPAFVRAAIDDLDWLGLRFDGDILFQSHHLEDYARLAERLREMGLLYPCSCTRSDPSWASSSSLDPEGQPVYPGTCRTRGPRPGMPLALRLDTGKALTRLGRRLTVDEKGITEPVAPELWGDPVLVRKDIGTSYHLAVVNDDARQHVTHVVRGTDLRAATSIHRLLQELLGYPAPHYHHHDLILHDTGRKLAKSAGDKSLAALREEGVTAADIRRALGFA
jgi:glutamyl-Q tRNA(Asp) synthetase